MLPKYKSKEYILDKLHRGFVNVCILTTIVSGSIAAYGVYQYFRYVRPYNKILKEKAVEELLAEGRHVQDAAIELNQ